MVSDHVLLHFYPTTDSNTYMPTAECREPSGKCQRIVSQRIPDGQTSHTESQSAIGAELARYDQEPLGSPVTQGNVRESSGNFTLSGEWSPCGDYHKATQ